MCASEAEADLNLTAVFSSRFDPERDMLSELSRRK